jgi:hypothetical protein
MVWKQQLPQKFKRIALQFDAAAIAVIEAAVAAAAGEHP